jgi:hypothetical protein
VPLPLPLTAESCELCHLLLCKLLKLHCPADSIPSASTIAFKILLTRSWFRDPGYEHIFGSRNDLRRDRTLQLLACLFVPQQ